MWWEGLYDDICSGYRLNLVNDYIKGITANTLDN